MTSSTRPSLCRLPGARSLGLALPLALIVTLVSAAAVGAQVTVVDMIPAAMSDETRNNAEPYIAVHPTNPQLMVATAFMATPAASPDGPLFVSNNGGATWVARNIIPSSPGSFFNTGDITIRFNSDGSALYGAILRAGTGQLEIIRTTDLTFTSPMVSLNVPRSTDQPYIYARTVPSGPGAGDDRVWVGNNENAVAPPSATVDQSLDAGIAAPAFAQIRIDLGAVVARDNYQVRTVAQDDGTVYAAFYRRRGNIAGGYNADVVVVRDDDWGQGLNPFRDLVDGVTAIAGQNVVASTPVSDTFGSSANLGREWWGGDLYLTVDPNDSSRPYISYSDSQAGAARTLHLRRSTDAGQTWTELLTVPSAKNAAIAITESGEIGYLYQSLVGTFPNIRWQTHLRRSQDDGATWDDLLLAEFPAAGPDAPPGGRIVGDYLNMVAVGEDYYGVFSSGNDLNSAVFPQGVTYLRNTTPPGDPSPSLLGVDGVTVVAPSVDPFFFHFAGAQPQIQVPGAVTIADTCVGATGLGTLEVCNTGTGDLIVDPITSSSPRFAVTTPSSGYPVTIAPGSCFPFQVTFDPTAAGPLAATLTVPSNDPDNPATAVGVSSQGTEPDIRVTGSGDYGVVSAWGSGERTFTVCNVGACDLSVASATLPGCGDFTISSDPFPAPLPPGACLDVTVAFTPALPGAKSCTLDIASDDPDTPVASVALSARTPPYFSLHAGRVDSHGALSAAVQDGSTVNLDFLYPFLPKWAWDVRLGLSRFDGQPGLVDIELATLSANARFTVNPAAPARFFLNAGLGLYHFDPGSFEGGGNLGLGLSVPIGPRFAFEATYNYHIVFTPSPDLEYDQIQLGFLVSF